MTEHFSENSKAVEDSLSPTGMKLKRTLLSINVLVIFLLISEIALSEVTLFGNKIPLGEIGVNWLKGLAIAVVLYYTLAMLLESRVQKVNTEFTSKIEERDAVWENKSSDVDDSTASRQFKERAANYKRQMNKHKELIIDSNSLYQEAELTRKIKRFSDLWLPCLLSAISIIYLLKSLLQE